MNGAERGRYEERQRKHTRRKRWVIAGVALLVLLVVVVILVIYYYPPYELSTVSDVDVDISQVVVNCDRAIVSLASTEGSNITVKTNVKTYYSDIFDGISIKVLTTPGSKTLRIVETDTMDISGNGLMRDLLTMITVEIALPISANSEGNGPGYDNLKVSVQVKDGNILGNISKYSTLPIHYVSLSVSNVGNISLKNLYSSAMYINVRDGNIKHTNLILPTRGIAIIRTMSGDITINGMQVANGSTVSIQANMGKSYIKLAPELSCLSYRLIGINSDPRIYEYGSNSFILNAAKPSDMTITGTLLSQNCTNTNVSITGDKVVLLLAQASVFSW